MLKGMAPALISTDHQAREAAEAILELDRALSSEQALKAIVEGLPREVVEGVRRSLATDRRERISSLLAYQNAKERDFQLLKERAGNDPGAFLIAARIMKSLSQKDLARRLGLREQAVQRWEAEKYRSISLSNYQKIAQVLGVRWELAEVNTSSEKWTPLYDIKREDLNKLIRHARAHGWLDGQESDESAIATLVRYVGDHVTRYGTPSLLRAGLNIVADRSDDWSLLSWKAQITRRAESIIQRSQPRYQPTRLSWLTKLVRLSERDDGPAQTGQLLLENGIVLVVERQIPGMRVDGAAFLADEVPVIGMTTLRDTIDNFWFTLLHEVAHIVLHYRTGLASGFFDDIEAPELDEFEKEANLFASSLLIPEEVWTRSPARIAKAAEPIDKLAKQLKIHPAIIFGRIRMERNDYALFSNRIGRGTVSQQFFANEGVPR
jgi:HTH-type transcriptional regulator/antitoxin HigA